MLKSWIKYGLFLSLLTPLIVTKSTFFPFIFGKAIFFQVLIEILFIFWLFSKPKLKWTKLNIALLIYFIILFISTIFSLDFTRSFWSTQERMTGFFNLAHFGLFFLMLSTLFNKKNFINLFRFSLGISIIVSVWSLIAWAPRLAGPLGNPGFLAQYLLFNLFFAIYLFISSLRGAQATKQSRVSSSELLRFTRNDNLWRIAYILIFLLNLITFYFTYTRGAYLGFFIGILVLILSQVWRKKKWLAILLIIVVLAAGFGVFRSQKRNFLRGSAPRLASWQIAGKAFLERPILSWGPENYVLAFAKYAQEDFPEEVWHDKAHNIINEYAVGAGLIGLLAYLAIYIVAGFSPILIAYLITNLFWLEMTSGLILFYIVLAWIERRRLEENKSEP